MPSDKKHKDVESGVLASIIYKSDKSGSNFMIGQFNGVNRQFTAKGDMFQPEIGVDYKLRGQWELNDKFGKQFKFYWHEVNTPTTSRGMYVYLVRICKWIGPSIANQICDVYGDKALLILKESPAMVAAQIKGITYDRAKEIQAALISNDEYESVMVKLEAIFSTIKNIPKTLLPKLVKEYGANAVKNLKENPYKLTKIRGIGFHTADEIALGIGFDRTSAKRERAAVWHVINESMQTSNSIWISMDEIFSKTSALIGVQGFDGLFRLQQSGAVVDHEGGFYAIKEADADESYIAQKIGVLLRHAKGHRLGSEAARV